MNPATFELDIKNLIHTIRGKQVMLDSDVAMLYHYETKKINQTVKRNADRFPENFCFQLNENELENLRSQTVTSSLEKENYPMFLQSKELLCFLVYSETKLRLKLALIL